MLAALPPPAPVGDLADRVSETVSAGSSKAALTAALAALQTRDRDVLLLVAWAELSYPEVAEVLAIPVGTVRSRLNRARRIVREHLPPDFPTQQETY
jgi:RNA polymerase sigma-70 factor (ECF subfamily)